jgi:hypothetical protein
MINLKPGNSSSTFRINGKPYQKGAYEIIMTGNMVGISRLSDYIILVTPQHYNQWTDDSDTPYASLADLQTDLEELFFLNNGAINISFVADNYSSLTSTFPTASIGSLAYVYNSQGTAWLPGTLGGIYYPEGIYFYSGAGWVSSRNAIAGELEDLIDDVASLQANKAEVTDARFPTSNEKSALQGTNGSPSNSNKFVTDSDPRNSNSRAPSGTTDGLPEGSTNQYFTNTRVFSSQDSMHRFATDAEKATWNTKQNALGFTPENSANKNAVNGYAGLDSDGLIPSSLLPSYVDDVLEFTNLASFPGTGSTGKIYVDLTTAKIYRWSGSVYIEISASPGSTDSVTEGVTNLYFTTARVLSTVLTGISFATNSAITATDTILVALGKLQAQITALIATAPSAGQKDALAGNNGTPSSSNTYVTVSGLVAALSQTGSPVTRSLNTAFQPSTTKPVNCRYNLSATCAITVSGTVTSQCFLETASSSSGPWTEVDSDGASFSTTLVIGFAQTIVLRCHLGQLIAAGVWVRIRTTGTIGYINGQETTIG